MEVTIASEPRPSTGQKILRHPLTRIILGLTVCLLAGSAVQLVLGAILIETAAPAEIQRGLVNILTAMVVLIAYKLFYQWIERRTVTELAIRDLPGGALTGTAIGGGLQALVILILFLLGYYSIITVNGPASLLPGFVLGIFSGVVEELIFRGILFRIIEEWVGSIFALAITAALFGFMHIFNPNATLWSAVAIAVEAGILLGAAYMLTRSLWMPIFLHFAWNFAESGIFGAPVSGHNAPVTFITARIEGPAILTGGEFGPENSIITVVLALAVGLWLFFLINKKGQLIAPGWGKSNGRRKTEEGK